MISIAKQKLLPLHLAQKYFEYSHVTGELTYKAVPKYVSSKKIGTPVGYMCARYLMFKFQGKLYSVHNVAWLLHHGVYSPYRVDHVDGNTHNNKMSNLREVSDYLNKRNQKKNTRNTSGYTGVTWHKHRGKWMSSIKIASKTHYLGYFDDPAEAYAVRKAFGLENGFTNTHGER